MRWLLLLLILPALAQAPQPRPEPVATHMQVRGADCALFPAVASMSPYESYITVTGRLTPTRQQADEAERSLLRLVANYPPNDSTSEYPDLQLVQARLRKYKRQYFGFHNKQQQPCVFINFFDNDPAVIGKSWLTSAVYVDDGGLSYWRITYNLSTHQFSRFWRNSWG